MEIQLLKAAVKETIKETITEIITAARRHQSAWLGRKRDRKGQGYESSSSITITHTITQTTSQATTPELPPLISYVHPFARRDRAWSPSLLTIDSEIEFSPEGSPPGAALGIPPEHILDEDPSPIDGPIPLNLAKAAAPATIWGADNYMVHKLSSFDGASSIVSFASHLGGIAFGQDHQETGTRDSQRV
ncbi:hypothetical protein BBK36DRAFT_1156120 [Trichoderma citrinoviride]|uniref:Uncharacterized protein n=1 Tax=Trichoderma citrinoviride TaxID=58853 RepID=A0A2T4BJW1_9HYPO|nr:hypothetical protein BBK36DRAFT_1156120 [Trichoderma citrinoviride]PTB69551.1 hypothetical protein BBK36DRAFT_1156120 [Trichoderma citrinoviride]